MTKKDTKFKPGVSGNPAGRPKKRECIPDILREITSRPHKDHTILYSILESIVEDALNGYKFAIEFVANRLEGKPRQTVVQETKPQDQLIVVDENGYDTVTGEKVEIEDDDITLL